MMRVEDFKLVLVILGLIAIVGLYPIYAIYYYQSAITKIVTVKEKWIKAAPGSNTMMYLFSDTEGNVYAVADELLLWKWDASDRWAKLEEGKTYRITFYGWRIHILSWYPNAIEIEEIEGND